MEQTMVIKGRKRVSREEIIKVQEKANRKAMTVRRVRTGALIAANVRYPSSFFCRCYMRSAWRLCRPANCLPRK